MRNKCLTLPLVCVLLSSASAFAQDSTAKQASSSDVGYGGQLLEMLDVILPTSKPETPAQPEPTAQPPIAEQAPVPNPKPAAEASSEAVDDRPYALPVPLADEVAKAQRARELKRVEHYLNSLTSIVADFTQVAPDGSLASGKFYMQRPGKMRWQYEPPTPVLMIMNGFRFIYYDYELEQVTQLPVDSNLAGLLAKKHIRLDDPDLVIDELVSSPGAVRIKLHQTGKKEEGSLMLEMSDQPLRIRNIIATDAQGQTTTVSLNKARFGVPLERSLFVWKDPRKKRR